MYSEVIILFPNKSYTYPFLSGGWIFTHPYIRKEATGDETWLLRSPETDEFDVSRWRIRSIISILFTNHHSLNLNSF